MYGVFVEDVLSLSGFAACCGDVPVFGVPNDEVCGSSLPGSIGPDGEPMMDAPEALWSRVNNEFSFEVGP